LRSAVYHKRVQNEGSIAEKISTKKSRLSSDFLLHIGWFKVVPIV
jgi:hypothetical protein